MLNIINCNKKHIYAIGDIHGEFKSIANWIKTHDIKDSALIFCGDFGLGFDGPQKEYQDLLRANKTCEERNIECYIVRGNHDDPSYYNKPSKNLDCSHFKPLSDYSIISCPKHNILCVGGAISTDRKYRQNAYETEVTKVWLRKHCSYEDAKKKVKLYWWEDEPFVYDEDILNEIINSDIKIDTICSHAAPEECYPITSSRVTYWESQDPTLKEDLSNERKKLSQLWHYLTDNNQIISNWYYGHYHLKCTEKINDTIFHLLDMGRNGKMSGDTGGFFDMKEIF